MKWLKWFGTKAAPAAAPVQPLKAKEDPRVAELRRLRERVEKLRKRAEAAESERDRAIAARNSATLVEANLRRENAALREERETLQIRLGSATSAAALAEVRAHTLRRW